VKMRKLFSWKQEPNSEKGSVLLNVAQQFLYLSYPKGISPRKLQKLTFYAQSLHLVLYNTPLFDEDFEAWVHGPISPDLYYHFKKYGTQKIPSIERPALIEEKAFKATQIIWKIYGHHSGKYLERKAFYEEAFQISRKGIPYYESFNEIIPKELMKSTFSKRVRIIREEVID